MRIALYNAPRIFVIAAGVVSVLCGLAYSAGTYASTKTRAVQEMEGRGYLVTGVHHKPYACWRGATRGRTGWVVDIAEGPSYKLCVDQTGATPATVEPLA